MESNLPATRDATDPEVERPTLAPSRPLTVALLPLALATFVILALTIAVWTFLAAAT
ncbi:MAG: hypothetical protein K5924_05905 [Chloroflexi bacterium]|nr:hypothetical protein [Chloroflexota bacterium]